MITILALQLSLSHHAQSPITAEQIAQGRSKSIISSSTPNITNPISYIDGAKGISIVGSTERKYFSEINSDLLAIIFHRGTQGLSVSFHQHGISDYSINTYSMGYAMKLTDRVSIGSNLKYRILQITESTNVHEICVDLSFRYQPISTLSFTVLAENLNRTSKLSNSSLTLGLQMNVSEKIALFSEWQYDQYWSQASDMILITGIDFHLTQDIRVLLGVNTLYMGPSIGLSYLWEDYLFSLGFINHHQLGASGSFGISKRF